MYQTCEICLFTFKVLYIFARTVYKKPIDLYINAIKLKRFFYWKIIHVKLLQESHWKPFLLK